MDKTRARLTGGERQGGTAKIPPGGDSSLIHGDGGLPTDLGGRGGAGPGVPGPPSIYPNNDTPDSFRLRCPSCMELGLLTRLYRGASVTRGVVNKMQVRTGLRSIIRSNTKLPSRFTWVQVSHLVEQDSPRFVEFESP